MKLKKKPKIIITIIIITLILSLGGVIIYKLANNKTPEIKEVKVLKSIEAYDYHLKDNKSKKYKDMFKELEDILRKEKVSDEDYVKKITELFIYDFYSLSDKTAKTDVGGVDFVHKSALENFLLKAEDTYYKYVESNLYGERKQELPLVNTITIESITPTEFAYANTKAEGYEVKANWTYTEEKYNDYQKSAKLIFVKEDIKYHLVELQ